MFSLTLLIQIIINFISVVLYVINETFSDNKWRIVNFTMWFFIPTNKKLHIFVIFSSNDFFKYYLSKYWTYMNQFFNPTKTKKKLDLITSDK